MTSNPKVTVTTLVAAQVPVDLAEALKKRAAAADRSMSAEVRLALKAHLETSSEDVAA